MIQDVWSGGDPDDVSGYLMDYLNSKFSFEGEPLSDKQLGIMVENRDPQLLEIITNIRNAIRAKNEDFDE